MVLPTSVPSRRAWPWGPGWPLGCHFAGEAVVLKGETGDPQHGRRGGYRRRQGEALRGGFEPGGPDHRSVNAAFAGGSSGRLEQRR